MSIEPIGIFAIFIGMFCLLAGNTASVTVLIIASVFGSAAALFIGSANIQPGHVMLGFLCLGVITRRREARAFVHAISPGQPGFWLALLVIYGVISAYFIPRILGGTTQIIPLGTTIYAPGSTVPLVPVSSNITQSVYMIGNLLCFAMTAALAAKPNGFITVASGLIGYATANALFGMLDIVTFATGSQGLMDFMRNAQYTLHTEDQVAGLKRIVGSFTEASSFARSSLGVLSFVGTLWLSGYRSLITGLLAATSGVLVVFSTSSTGLVGAPVVMILLYTTAVTLCLRKTVTRNSVVAVIVFPLILLTAALYIAIDPVFFKIVYSYVDIIVLGKSDSDSGVERHSWNVLAMQNFFDSWGLGVGLGTVRTSSLIVALVANVGIPGTLFYAAFAYTALVNQTKGSDGLFKSVRLAARNGCLGLMMGDLLASPAIDQGLAFYILAALAASYPERAFVFLHSRVPVEATA